MKTLPYDLVDEASREPCLDFRRRPGRGTTSWRPSEEPRPGALWRFSGTHRSEAGSTGTASAVLIPGAVQPVHPTG